MLFELRGFAHSLGLSVFLLKHVCALFVCAFTKGQTRQIRLDTQGGPRNLGVMGWGGSSLPNNQVNQNDSTVMEELICEKTETPPRALIDGLFAVHVKILECFGFAYAAQ